MRLGMWIGVVILLVAIGTGVGVYRKTRSHAASTSQVKSQLPDAVLLSTGQDDFSKIQEEPTSVEGREPNSDANEVIASEEKGTDNGGRSAQASTSTANAENEIADFLDDLEAGSQGSDAINAQLKLDEARVLRGNEKWEQALQIYDDVIEKFGSVKASKKDTFGDRANQERTVTQCLKRKGWGDLANSKEELVNLLIEGIRNQSYRKIVKFASPCEFYVGEISKNQEVKAQSRDVAQVLADSSRDFNAESVAIHEDKIVLKSQSGRRVVELAIDRAGGGWHWIGVKSNDRSFLSSLAAPR